MKKIKHIILIPVYNDWKSLQKLISEINKVSKNLKDFETQILIVDDNSSKKIRKLRTRFNYIKKIQILTLKKNLGSQKAIAVGLFYLKNLNKDFFITVMDSDGEDKPQDLKRLMILAKKNKSWVITSNRKKRKETFLIRILYSMHLMISYIFTLNWISFGNFTSFHSKNLPKILKDNSSWYAHSSSIINNCKIKRIYAKRGKRYFDKSKLNLYDLFEHSLRVNAVFFKKILLISIIYLLLISIFFSSVPAIKYFLIISILFFNLCVFLIKIKHHKRNLNNLNSYLS